MYCEEWTTESSAHTVHNYSLDSIEGMGIVAYKQSDLIYLNRFDFLREESHSSNWLLQFQVLIDPMCSVVFRTTGANVILYF